MCEQFGDTPELLVEAFEKAIEKNHVKNPTRNSVEQLSYVIVNYILDELLTAKLSYTPTMLAFQQLSTPGDPDSIDHRKNASHLVAALESIPTRPTLSITVLPKITEVIHEKEGSTTLFMFQNDAVIFKKVYQKEFDTNYTEVIKNDSPYWVAITISRENYRHLVSERLIEFQLVTVPAEINKEQTLINKNGEVDALSLIAQGRALVRALSTAPLRGEKLADYDYFFQELADPVNNRYTKQHEDKNRHLVYDPRNGNIYTRTVSIYPPVRFQEPETKPTSLQYKLDNGWTIGSGYGEPKNTIFTKKRSYSLLPAHGQMIPYEKKMSKLFSNYFPIGILSDSSQVDLKDWRYVWTQNMQTKHKSWVLTKKNITEEFYTFLSAIVDPDGIIHFDQEKAKKIFKNCTSSQLLSLSKEKEQKFIEQMNLTSWMPQDKDLEQFSLLLQQEKDYILSKLNYKNAKKKQISQEILTCYKNMGERLTLESKRAHIKYSVPYQTLLDNNDKEHNEILAAITKTAVQALYAVKDELFDRLNLICHAIRIKNIYKYDVPLLVISQDKSPYHYTEDMIKKDLIQAYHMVLNRQISYDKTELPVWEKINGTRSLKIDPETGKPITLKKNIEYQDNMLLQLFQTSNPGMSSLQELQEIGDIEESGILEMVEITLDALNIVGRLTREKVIMDSIFNTEDPDESLSNISKMEDFFLRTAALGHTVLLREIISKFPHYPHPDLVNKAMLSAIENKHPETNMFLANCLSKSLALKKVRIQLAGLPGIIDKAEKIKQTHAFCQQHKHLLSEDSAIVNSVKDILFANYSCTKNIPPNLIILLSCDEIALEFFTRFMTENVVYFALNDLVEQYHTNGILGLAFYLFLANVDTNNQFSEYYNDFYRKKTGVEISEIEKEIYKTYNKVNNLLNNDAHHNEYFTRLIELYQKALASHVQCNPLLHQYIINALPKKKSLGWHELETTCMDTPNHAMLAITEKISVIQKLRTQPDLRMHFSNQSLIRQQVDAAENYLALHAISEHLEKELNAYAQLTILSDVITQLTKLTNSSTHFGNKAATAVLYKVKTLITDIPAHLLMTALTEQENNQCVELQNAVAQCLPFINFSIKKEIEEKFPAIGISKPTESSLIQPDSV